MVAVWAPYERFFFNPRKVGSVVSAYERLLSAFGSPMSDVPIEISKNIERKALIPLTNLLYKMFQNFKMLKNSRIHAISRRKFFVEAVWLLDDHNANKMLPHSW